MHKGFHFSTPLPTLLSSFWEKPSSQVWDDYLTVVLICISLLSAMLNTFHVLVGHLDIFFGEVSVKILCPFCNPCHFCLPVGILQLDQVIQVLLTTGMFLGGFLGFPLVVQAVKNLPAVKEAQVWSLVREDPQEKGMATHSSVLAWRIPWTEEPGRIQFMGS